VKRLPVEYDKNKCAWMTASLFEKYIRKIDNKMKCLGRKIVIIMDNCPSHPQLKKLFNVELICLPKNTTAKLQPMDAGVIRMLKANYRRRLAKRRLLAFDNNMPFSINVLEALNLIKASWEEIDSTKIEHCFQHAGIICIKFNIGIL